jgi:hypothetical protein
MPPFAHVIWVQALTRGTTSGGSTIGRRRTRR